MLDLQRVRGHVPFKREGWRRIGFWWAVFFAGVAIGTRWAHPDLSFLEVFTIQTAPSEALASGVAGLCTLAAFALLTLIIGADKLIEVPERD